jgi:mono/diheme cytochrome c family protein
MRKLLFVTIPFALWAQAQKAPDAENGKKLFAKDGCYECHNYEGQGGAAGPRIAPKPIPFAAFAKYVRRPTNQMPPFTAKALPDNDLADIYAYLQSIPAPPPAKDLPQLKNY